MQRDTASLFDILDSARLILGYVQGRTCDDLLQDVGLQDQVARRFEIIGEAAGRLTNEMRDRLDDIPWRSLVGLRNVLIHEYGEVDYAKLWDIIQGDLQRLIIEIEPLVPPPTDF
jgi:uncharacterized protein with HEPN domain